MTDYSKATLIVAFMILGFTQSPFSVLIYAQIAFMSTNWSEWILSTMFMLVAQITYMIKKAFDD